MSEVEYRERQQPSSELITYELLSHIIERSSSIVSLFKELENIRIDA